MERKPEIKAELPPISQIGILVNDAAKTAEYYSSVLGIGPFRTYDVDMPEGTTLERTQGVVAALCEYLGTVPEVMDYTVYTKF